ncbi:MULTISPECIES: N-acetylglucosamine-6-phosphate deacetylase [Methylosinus]|uniref:N-acetylglucosamine-6-phosphate deacetylase n=1 Tax=Methylosinus trichosporium (strain ATCC 35070 / NCIMB 11131 / UNIQEM 75 / OB3b) TaxID=595536 RepID=A0A2D2D3I9_METT3|nr:MULTISPECIES: N-acetylglucosamine-6-phosphate deacetylase [Methylosinus]ATQ69429.1 N-acetylglucosamine-6-phosphate deacetylase [Methylosinus trichosporium OB3b]OBS52940.1 N-acetylglucosamine-6-phosphate deacetylase [Methylosinus sp. 3S-1]
MKERLAIAADIVFDGDSIHRDAAVLIEDEAIVALTRRDDVAAATIVDLPAGAWLAPGFIDLQVNGGGDVLFNDEPTPDAIATILRAHRRFGTTSLLPTLITDTDEKMRAAAHAIADSMTRERGVLGVHFEGPFLSPRKLGVHRGDLVRRPEPHHLAILAPPPGCVSLVTLAPEEVPDGFIAALTRAGCKIALGHSMASYEETRTAMRDGLTGFTHLFNAMRPLGSREGGPIAAALESPDACYGLIVDGEHVHSTMLRLALRASVGHPMLVTDAMPPVGGHSDEFALQGRRILARDGRCVTEDGVLAGAALDMASAVRNCVARLGLPLERALTLASREPAHFLGLGDRLGRLAPGYRADMVAFAPHDVSIIATWVAGAS